MIDKKTENSIKSLIKILKKERLSSIKFSNKFSSIELSQEITSQITRNSNNITDEEAKVLKKFHIAFDVWQNLHNPD